METASLISAGVSVVITTLIAVVVTFLTTRRSDEVENRYRTSILKNSNVPARRDDAVVSGEVVVGNRVDVITSLPPTVSGERDRLWADYHAQGLAQSKQSFVAALVFASLGGAILLGSIGLAVANVGTAANAPLISASAGVVCEVAAAVFFRLANAARETMSDFFERLADSRQEDLARETAVGLLDRIAGDDARDAAVGGLIRVLTERRPNRGEEGGQALPP